MSLEFKTPEEQIVDQAALSEVSSSTELPKETGSTLQGEEADGSSSPETTSEAAVSTETSEDAIVEKMVSEGGQKSPEDLYAQLFYLYMPKMQAELRGMSNKQLRRLLKALIEGPLSDKPVKMMEVGEKMVYHMASNLLEARFGMQLAFMAEKQRKEQEQKAALTSATEKALAEQKFTVVDETTNNNEVNNG